MSESAPAKHHEQAEVLTTPEKLEALPTPEQAEPLRPGEADPTKRAEQARETVEQTAAEDNPVEQLEAEERSRADASPTYINRELKTITLRREINTLRRHLPATQRALSRVIHQPVVRAVSEASAKTVSRPSGLLGGGLTAFVGTTAYLYFAKHIGLPYNYTVFLLLFVGGFILGLFLELLVWLLTSRHRHQAD